MALLNPKQLICLELPGGVILATAPDSEFSNQINKAENFLTPAELDYYRGLKAEKRKRSFLLGRLAAKRALRSYLGEENPRSIDITWGVFQQPVVRYSGTKLPGISIAHTDHLAVALVFPILNPMGIDLEKADARRLGGMQRVMTLSEKEQIVRQASEEQASAVIWTAKEALSKAILLGMTFPFELFEVKEWSIAGNEASGSFRYFSQFHFLSRILEDQTVLTVVFPKKSGFSLNGKNQ